PERGGRGVHRGIRLLRPWLGSLPGERDPRRLGLEPLPSGIGSGKRGRRAAVLGSGIATSLRAAGRGEPFSGGAGGASSDRRLGTGPSGQVRFGRRTNASGYQGLIR